jgi:hypothetical protein
LSPRLPAGKLPMSPVRARGVPLADHCRCAASGVGRAGRGGGQYIILLSQRGCARASLRADLIAGTSFHDEGRRRWWRRAGRAAAVPVLASREGKAIRFMETVPPVAAWASGST